MSVIPGLRGTDEPWTAKVQTDFSILKTCSSAKCEHLMRLALPIRRIFSVTAQGRLIVSHTAISLHVQNLFLHFTSGAAHHPITQSPKWECLRFHLSNREKKKRLCSLIQYMFDKKISW